jgi:acetyltransferase-like isoleucine patch superfamily enzyme
VRIDSFCKLEGGRGLAIGAHVHVPSFCHLNVGGGTVILEEECGPSPGVRILGGSSDPGWPSMSAAAAPGRWRADRDYVTVIRARAFLGTNAVIMPGVTVGESAIVGAGAVVTKDVPAGQVWTGVPARFAGWRPGWGPGDRPSPGARRAEAAGLR